VIYQGIRGKNGIALPPSNCHQLEVETDEVFHTRGFAAVAAAAPSPVVFVDKSSRVIICQGIKGKNGTFDIEQTIEKGTDMVRPRRGILKMQSLLLV
jgi:succinyl-CoA synthetase alpha subunit